MMQWIVSSSVLILVIIALRFLLRKRIKPILQYGLWALVLVRLLVPLQVGSTPISLENAVEKAPVVQQMELADQVEHFDYHLDGFATGYYTFSPALDHDPESGTHNEPVPELFTHEEADRLTTLRSAREYLTSLWIGGMILMTAAFFLSNLIFALRLRKSRKLLNVETLPVYVTEATETPCYFGLHRPAIYLPPAVAADEHHRIFAVTHELTHYRHGDEIWAALRCLCLVVHWYNPLVWLAAILSREDCEIACDEATIATLGENRRTEYGRVLIDLTCRRYTDLLRTATTMTGSALGLKDRIKMIVKKPKTAIYALITVILVATIAVGCTFTGGSKVQNTTDPTEITDPTDNTNPSEPEQTDYLQSIYGTPLTEAELSYFTELFAHTGTAEKEEEINWYNLILTCGWDHGTGRTGFTVPENVNLATLFNNGFRAISNVDNWTAEELAFIQGFYPGYPENWGDLNRLPAEKMNRVLQDYFGITLDKTNKVWLDKMHYFADTNCYFGAPAGATGEQKVNMLAGKKIEAGTVYLICTTNTSKMLDRILLIALDPAPEGAAKPYLVRMCTQIKQAQDVTAAIQTTIPLPSEEELNATGTTATEPSGTTATEPSETVTTEPSETTATQPSETQPFAPVPLDPNCEHSFMAATCTAPKTCLNCGGTEGKPRAKHVFMEASCSEPSTCFYCDATVGEPLPHTFVDGSCKVCRAHDPVRPFNKITSWVARYVNQDKECEEFGKVLSIFMLHPAPTNSTNSYQYTYYDLYSNRSYLQHPNGEGFFYEGTVYYDFYFTGYPEGTMHYTVLDNDHVQVSLYVYTESWTGQELLVQFEMVRASDTTFRVTSSTNTSAIPVDLVFEARGSWAEGKGISVP